MLDKAVADGPVVHLGLSARTLKMNFMKLVTFGFLLFSIGGWFAPRSELGPGRCSLLL
jgi:hypothetical protein